MNLTLPLGAAAVGVLGNYATVLIFVLIGFFFAAVALGVAKLLRPRNPSPAKMTTYECGELPTGSSWIRFNVRFYLIALFFIVFDVEVIFLYPWAVVFKQLFPHPQLGTLGLAYIWVKGDLDWVKKLAEHPEAGERYAGLPESRPASGLNAAAEEEVPAS
jgi:NADH-quinone oxidoreductase subunit A